VGGITKSPDKLYWFDCYDSDARFKKYVTKESFSHPAKASFGLLTKILDHLEFLGLLTPNQVIVDFMAGTGRVNLMAAMRGYRTVSIELEKHFVDMIRGNKTHAEQVIGRKLDWDIIEEDSRNLSKLLNESGVGIVSPPYTNTTHSSDNNFVAPHDSTYLMITQKYNSENPSQIANLPDKPLVSITSPAYGNRLADNDPRTHMDSDGKYRRPNTAYGGDASNIGNSTGETYLGAVEKCYLEAHRCGISPLVLITKNPTRGGKLRDLCGDTARILEKIGYKIVDYHRAVLWKEVKDQTLDGDVASDYKGRLSFFKRMSLERGNVAAKWEDIIFAVIPDLEGLVGLTSPAYSNIEIGKGLNTKPPRKGYNDQSGRSSMAMSQRETRYSDNPANIGNLPDKPLVGITSPAYVDMDVSLKDRKDDSANWIRSETGQKHVGYTKDKDRRNIGNLKDK